MAGLDRFLQSVSQRVSSEMHLDIRTHPTHPPDVVTRSLTASLLVYSFAIVLLQLMVPKFGAPRIDSS